ncbi:MAG: hypothetical protein AMJ54_00350 [Deltaproteobacteria bacterium SG8_13]|nr:MAG: hypothetical protein AMJ54_00350 [Deltaproteobacteria bacterium SG8_13]
MRNKHLYILCFLLAAAGLGGFLFKALVLYFPVWPGEKSTTWNIEAQISFTAIEGPVKLSLHLPRNSSRFAIINENFISRGYGVTTSAKEGKRIATWSIRRSKGPQTLYYSASVHRMEREDIRAIPPSELTVPDFKGVKREAAQSLITDIREKSADLQSLVPMLIGRINRPQPGGDIELLLGKEASRLRKIELAENILALIGVHTRSAHGIRLTDQGKDIPLVHWLEVLDRKRWVAYNFDTGESELPEDYFPWWRGADPILQAQGVKKARVELSVVVSQEEAIRSAISMEKISRPVLNNFSIFGLPLQIQSVYRILLLVPIGALLLVILRNVVGLKTFGTFMPVLIALAFRETQLIWGIVLFTLLVAAGMCVRLYLEHLKLLVVPRLAAILTVVILLMLAFSVLTHKLGLERGMSVALFPMVILAMTIERMSVIWDETGPADALAQAAGTLLAAAGAYLIMSIQIVEHVVFVFPELLLIVLAVVILLGRYSGYRLLELGRFKAMEEE